MKKILYVATVDMCKKGYKEFHLGGGYGGDESPLLRFKRNFNKSGELDFYIAKRIFYQELYDKLVSIREKKENFDNNSKYFPLYRSRFYEYSIFFIISYKERKCYL